MGPTTLPTSSTKSPSCWHAGLAQRVTQNLAGRANHSLHECISRSSLRRDAFSTSSRSLVRPNFLGLWSSGHRTMIIGVGGCAKKKKKGKILHDTSKLINQTKHEVV